MRSTIDRYAEGELDQKGLEELDKASQQSIYRSILLPLQIQPYEKVFFAYSSRSTLFKIH